MKVLSDKCDSVSHLRYNVSETAVRQTLCCPKPTSSKKRVEFLCSYQCSLHGCLDNSRFSWPSAELDSKAQTPRNLMLRHRKWCECSPSKRTYTHVVSTSLILSLYSPRIHIYFYNRKMNSSTGNVLFWKSSLFISYSLLFIQYPRNEFIHNLLPL